MVRACLFCFPGIPVPSLHYESSSVPSFFDRNLSECLKLKLRSPMNFPDHPFLQVSLEVYQNFPYLTTDLLPDECLNVWAANHISEAYQNKLGFSFFMLLFNAHKAKELDLINKDINSYKVSYDSDIEELNTYYKKFQQILMAEQICRQLKIKMNPIMIFDIAHYPVGFQLAVDKTAVEKAMMFKSMMSDKGIDL